LATLRNRQLLGTRTQVGWRPPKYKCTGGTPRPLRLSREHCETESKNNTSGESKTKTIAVLYKQTKPHCPTPNEAGQLADTSPIPIYTAAEKFDHRDIGGRRRKPRKCTCRVSASITKEKEEYLRHHEVLKDGNLENKTEE